MVRAQHGQQKCGGGRDHYVPVPTPQNCHPRPLARPGVPAAPEPGVPAGAASGAGRGRGRCYEGALGARGVPPVSQCKFTESQGTAARLRLCPGQPGGSGGSSPAVQRGGEPGWGTRGRGTVPAVRPAGLVLAVRATACGVPRAMRPRGEPAPRGGQQGGGASRGPGIQPRGGAAPGAAVGRHSSFSRGCGGVRVEALPRGHGQPPVPPVRLPEGSVQLLQLGAQRQVDLQVHAQRLQPLLQLGEGRPEQQRGHVVAPLALSPPCPLSQGAPGVSITHRFSGSRSQQQTAMGKKLGGQAGGQ